MKKREQKRENLLFGAAEGALLVCFALYLLFVFGQDTAKAVDVTAMQQAIDQQCDLGELQPGNGNTLKQLLSTDGTEYVWYLVYTSDSLMNVDELLIVHTKNDSQLAALETAVQAHLDQQRKSFEGYGVDQTERLESAVIREQGDYFFYGVSADVAQWEDTFLRCVR
jgi:hypothetical protein